MRVHVVCMCVSDAAVLSELGHAAHMAEQRRVRQRTGELEEQSAPGPACAVPSHAAWFRLDDIHAIERRSLPEFFDGDETKTSEAYKHMRNFIIATYREQPGLHLSVTECRRNIAADVGAVMRVHQFLEHWGLVNYNATTRDTTTMPSAGTRAGSVVLDGPTAATFSATAVVGHYPTTGTVLPLRSGMDSDGGTKWAPQETLHLLDALDGIGEGSWEEVAVAVGRPVQDCVGHFLSLPIEEPYAYQALTQPTAWPQSLPMPSSAASALASDAMLGQLAFLATAVSQPSSSAEGARAPLNAGGSPAKVVDEVGSGGEVAAVVEVAAHSIHAAAKECMASVQVGQQEAPAACLPHDPPSGAYACTCACTCACICRPSILPTRPSS